jgi:hypothetical protein
MARLLVVHVAVRMLPLPTRAFAAHPVIDAAPSLKFTVPVGEVPLTVAVKVTLMPTTDGLAELDNAVVLVVAVGVLTICDSGALAEALLFASPP